jgi:hypothetical protein
LLWIAHIPLVTHVSVARAKRTEL